MLVKQKSREQPPLQQPERAAHDSGQASPEAGGETSELQEEGRGDNVEADKGWQHVYSSELVVQYH